ncbi:MAG: AAA domain-containing protein, partial [Pirellulaceae bacterium]|nr:AAA domain-containing protein [Pirellulaceae bacterium]
MDDKDGDVARDDFPMPAESYQPARFHADLRLPSASEQLVKDAAAAIRQEYRDCSKWKRLTCRKVSIFAERDRGTVWVVHVGSTVEFDWTWEGAIAFRPKSLDEGSLFSKNSHEEFAFQDEILWKGEVLEVDECNGCLFISIDNPEAMPTTGSFFVRPFEFLSVLDQVYNDSGYEELRSDLPQRLAATEGDIHPVINNCRATGLPHLRDWWQHAWSVLWGPPGTGKTWTAGQQIAAVLDDPTERILVVSTTNRATDTIALSIGNAARVHTPETMAKGQLLRVGSGASIRNFSTSALEAMLMSTESEVLHKIDDLAGQLRLFDNWEEKALARKQIGELRSATGDQSKRNFLDSEVRVVITTAFKATTFLKDRALIKM